MSRFAGLSAAQEKPVRAVTEPKAEAKEPGEGGRPRAKAREGKHGVMGYYSTDLMRAMRVLAAEEGKTIQALLGEAIDLLMRDRGKHPFGER